MQPLLPGARVTFWMLVVGPALIALVAYDAAVTTLWTTAAGGPLTRRLGRGWWVGAHRLARRPDSALLTSAGPLILITTTMTWLSLLWLGWALVFAADASAVISSPGDVPAGWWGRAYFAGFSVFTLGVGDLVPVGAPWRLLTVFASASGLALTTVAITYLIPVTTAATDRSTQASTIAGLGGQSHRIVSDALGDGSVRYLEPVLLQLTQSLLLTAERHLAYPVLHYFHPASPRTDLRVQLLALDDALTLVEHGLDPSVERPHPAAISGARNAVRQLVERAHVTSAAAAAPLTLDPLRGVVPLVTPEEFADGLAPLAEHRERVADYAAESAWADVSADR